MLTSELDYDLPPELIAQHPVVPRDNSRLLVYDRKRCTVHHKMMADLPALLNTGDALVYNDSRVIRARVFAKKPTGGRVELLFLRRYRGEVWEALARPSARLKQGVELGLEVAGEKAGHDGDMPFLLQEHLGEGRWLVKNLSSVTTEELLEQVGEMPLPPYINEPLRYPAEYQTVFADKPGSAAAPTAGLHFTPALIGRLHETGIALAPITLHIGLDTFRPVDEDELQLHIMHKEHYRLPQGTLQAVNRTRGRGGRVVAVGTTSARVLETVFSGLQPGLEGETDLFITPGHEFKAVDAILTNFHLPRSTLLAMVMAFAGIKETRKLYEEAIRNNYRFYSFGDAMLVK